jgi:hypothetical protein
MHISFAALGSHLYQLLPAHGERCSEVPQAAGMLDHIDGNLSCLLYKVTDIIQAHLAV